MMIAFIITLEEIIQSLRLELSRLFLHSFNEWRCLRCLSFCRWRKTEKHSCRSSVISMRPYPPQYPRSSTPLNPSPSHFLCSPFFFLPLFSSHFAPSFPPFSFCPFSFSSFFLSWPPLSFFLVLSTFDFMVFSYFFCVCACVCVSRVYVRAYLAIPCVSADDNVEHTKSNIRYDNKINKMKQMWNI